MRTLELLHTRENTIDIMPAASRAKSRLAQTAVRVRDGMESKVANDRVLKVGLQTKCKVVKPKERTACQKLERNKQKRGDQRRERTNEGL